MTNSTCREPWTCYQKREYSDSLDTSIMHSITQSMPRTCLDKGDLQGLHFLYPVCDDLLPAEVTCTKATRQTGYLRLACVAGVPFTVAALLILVPLTCMRWRDQKRVRKIESELQTTKTDSDHWRSEATVARLRAAVRAKLKTPRPGVAAPQPSREATAAPTKRGIFGKVGFGSRPDSSRQVVPISTGASPSHTPRKGAGVGERNRKPGKAAHFLEERTVGVSSAASTPSESRWAAPRGDTAEREAVADEREKEAAAHRAARKEAATRYEARLDEEARQEEAAAVRDAWRAKQREEQLAEQRRQEELHDKMLVRQKQHAKMQQRQLELAARAKQAERELELLDQREFVTASDRQRQRDERRAVRARAGGDVSEVQRMVAQDLVVSDVDQR